MLGFDPGDQKYNQRLDEMDEKHKLSDPMRSTMIPLLLHPK